MTNYSDAKYGIIPGAGVTIADQYRLISGQSTSVAAANNLERNDRLFATVGGCVNFDQPTGIFTFPQTGVYNVTFTIQGSINSAAGSNFGLIEVDTGSSGFLQLNMINLGKPSSGNEFQNSSGTSFVNVTDTATFQCRFGMYMATGSTFEGNSNANRTFMTFMRIGDAA